MTEQLTQFKQWFCDKCGSYEMLSRFGSEYFCYNCFIADRIDFKKPIKPTKGFHNDETNQIND